MSTETQPCSTCARCRKAVAHSVTMGALGGLVYGIIRGVIDEKLFVFRNVVKDYHLRDPPIQLFSVLRRGIVTVPVAAAFLGVYSGTRCMWQHQLEPSHPVYAGCAGSAAGAVRTLMGEAALHPLVHLQKSLGSGLFAAGMLGFVQYVASEHQKELQARQHSSRQLELVWEGRAVAGRGLSGELPAGSAGPSEGLG